MFDHLTFLHHIDTFQFAKWTVLHVEQCRPVPMGGANNAVIGISMQACNKTDPEIVMEYYGPDHKY